MGLASAWNSLWGKASQPKEIKELNGSFFYVFGGGDADKELDFKLLYKVYLRIPHLRAVIDQRCTMFANGRLYIKKRDSEDEILYDHPLQAKLNKPNAFQSTREWMFMIQAYKCISGDAFIYKNYSVGKNLRNLQGLTPIDYDSMKVKARNDALPFEVTDTLDYIKSIEFTFRNGATRKFKDMSELIHFRDTGIKFTDATSKIITHKDTITNIYEALKARQTMIKRKGGIGALTGNQKNGDMAIPLAKKEKEEMQQRLNQYGLGAGKDPVIVTDVPMRWQPFVFPTRELMLFEEIQDGFHQLCDAYGIRREIFEGQSNYSNKEHAERGTYQDTIIPEWEDFVNKLNMELNTEADGIEICVDYSHIPILQENEKENIEMQKVKSDMLLNEISANLITPEEYRDQMGYDGPPPEPKEQQEEPGNEEEEQEDENQ